MAQTKVRFVSMVAMTAMFVYPRRVLGLGALDWATPDRFDEVDSHFRSVGASTCRSRSKDRMVMRADIVAQLPVYNQLLSKVWYPNRTALIHVHNMALNRAFFYSYIFQTMNDSASFHKQPNYLYYYLSSAADVNANPTMLNGSAFYFDNNCCYPNWFITVPFNRTLSLFAPKATRWDDYQDQDNLLREPTRTVVAVKDAGAGLFSNYTHPGYKMNTWYKTWLPDVTGDKDSLTKFTYHVGIRRSVKTGQFLTTDFQSNAFFGPPSPGASERDPQMLPVQWTAPYFDCGGSNKWVVSAVSPVVDFMPRYSNYTHLRRQRVVGLAVMDIDLNQIDFNACGISPGNPGPSYLSGVHKCKKTTSCKHVSGYGLKRGGYKCVCKAGSKYPWSVEPVFMGVDIEQATRREYKDGFSCEKISQALVLPMVDSSTGVQQDDLLGQDDIPASRVNVSRHKRSHLPCHPCDNGSISNLELGPMTADNAYLSAKDLDIVQSERASQDLDTASHETWQRLTTSDVMAGHPDLQQALKVVPPLTSERREVLHKSPVLHLHRDRQTVQGGYSSRAAAGSHRRRKRSIIDEASFDRMKRILRQKARVTSLNCHQLPEHLLQLPGDVGYGVEKQFEPEGRTALRLAHFLSVYLQNAHPEKNVGNVKGGGLLQEEHLMGEVLANVMSNIRVLAGGLFFDRFTFIQKGGVARELFGPWAFRQDGGHYVMDTAGLTSQYVNEDWFLQAKTTFSGNFAELGIYKIRAHVRSNPKGVSSVRFGYFPLTYRAASYQQGQWTRPYFRCDGYVNAWVMTYVSPFFGLDSLGSRLQFRGVVTVDVPLDRLEINQCPQPFSVANAFKNTALCDYFSTTCSPLAGFPFSRGAYMCSCRLGFEYWHADGKEWFEGSFIEFEYLKKKAGIFNRFDHLYCRPSAACFGRSTGVVLIVATFMLSIQ